jgi:hypothetical protein
MTWSIAPAGQYEAAELDVRACPTADLQRFKSHHVLVHGKLIPRENHCPLLVVERLDEAPTISKPIVVMAQNP